MICFVPIDKLTSIYGNQEKNTFQEFFIDKTSNLDKLFGGYECMVVPN